VISETPSVAISYPRQPSAVAGPAAEVAKALTQPNTALLLPEGGQMLRSIGLALAKNKIDPTKTRILGTSIWEDGLTPTTPIAKGGWYATVASELILGFEQKYIVGGANPPPRLASLSYDAAQLALKLYRAKDYSATAITNRSGFAGANGAYRFLTTGLSERKLTIMQMTPLGSTVLLPAENSFN
jgi:branched-chain amino acid transport system substrate-binding protein